MTTQFETGIMQKLCEMQEQAVLELIELTGFKIRDSNLKNEEVVCFAIEAIKLTGYIISQIETTSALECSYILQRHGVFIAQRDVSVKIKVDNKKEEDRVEEVNFKKGEIFGDTKRKLIVGITGKPFTFCCDELKEFAKSHPFYLDFQIRDMKKTDPANPCLLLEDDRGHRSWYSSCPFCGADIVVKEVKQKNKAEETKVIQKEDKAVIVLWLKKETLKHLRLLAHKQPEAFLSQEEEIATYIEKFISKVEEGDIK